ncbi:hypothetical protein JOD55_001471 [Arcanobacterium pluranimalium]|uniref:hypothetical protein n=1 Tax=Arcanobacterium pluranimalium TaxID=108028 RepID=UPI00195D5894|nr:hypothetical protein [Arcanobacterium pluranimalium]MBM7825644.1 hypothetical protein [Arcanobacterium pluranimalium]
MAIALFALGLFVMETRWENASPTAPTPDAAEVSRQELAIETGRLMSAAQANPQFQSLTPLASTWQELLGGIWIPWKEEVPQGQENPVIDTAATAHDAQSLVNELNKFSLDVHKIGDDGAQAQLTTSISASTQILAARLAANTGVPLSISTPIPTTISQLVPDAESLKRIEMARQWIELKTAQTPAPARGSLPEVIAFLDQVISLAIDRGVPDSRPALTLPAANTEAAELLAKEFISMSANANLEQRQALSLTIAYIYAITSAETPSTPGYIATR